MSAAIPEVASESQTRSAALLTSKWFWLPLLLLGVAARFRQYAACPSYWYDEAYTLLNIFSKSFVDLLGPLDNNQVMPPLFAWTQRALYLLAGSGEWAMRLPSFLASVAALLLMVPLARRFVRGPGWVVVVALCAVSDHALYHGYEAKPYSGDFLIAELILLAGFNVVIAREWRWLEFAVLAVCALLGPWASLPSVFVLAGASVALFCAAWRRGDRRWWVGSLVFNVLLASSAALLWLCVGRHAVEYPFLKQQWVVGWNGFPDTRSFTASMRWLVQRPFDIADYGTGAMGIPLVLLALAGGFALAKQSRALLVLLLAPFGIAIVAACLQRYPLGDRTAFFLAPSCWLLAGVGLSAVLSRSGKLVWVGVALVTILVLPGTVRMSKALVVVSPKIEYREALVHVHERLAAGDHVWVAHPEVYQVYFGKDDRLLGWYTPPAEVEQDARTGRLWVVRPPLPAGADNFYDMAGTLAQSAGKVVVERYPVKGLEVVLFDKPASESVARR
jgi:hypothetical protein